jgi:hypothetical protein
MVGNGHAGGFWVRNIKVGEPGEKVSILAGKRFTASANVTRPFSI